MTMNIFRLCGDMSHLFSIIVLLLRLRVAKNASGEFVLVAAGERRHFGRLWRYIFNFPNLTFLAIFFNGKVFRFDRMSYFCVCLWLGIWISLLLIILFTIQS
jgi:hypothetical protein